MKIWRGYGSAHSAHLVVVGQFKTVEDAKLAAAIVGDFANAGWEERYPNLGGFINAWKQTYDYLPYLGLSESDFHMGIDRECGVELNGTRLAISSRSNQIGGIIKLMLLKEPTEIKVTGTMGP